MTNIRVGLELPQDIKLIESNMLSFHQETADNRAVLVGQVKEADAPIVIVDLPYYDSVKGAGVGFALQLQSLLAERYPATQLTQIDCQYWGVPLDYKRLFLVASQQPLASFPKRAKTTVGDWDATVLYHSITGMPLSKVSQGLIPATPGFRQSRTAAFGDPAHYRLYRPVIARQQDDTYLAMALTPMEWSGLFGVEMLTDNTLFQLFTPTKVLNEVAAQLIRPVEAS